MQQQEEQPQAFDLVDNDEEAGCGSGCGSGDGGDGGDGGNRSGGAHGHLVFGRLQKENARLRSVVAAMKGELQALHADAHRATSAGARTRMRVELRTAATKRGPARKAARR